VKAHRHINIRPDRIEASLIGNGRSHLDFLVKTAKGYTHYHVMPATGLLVEMVDMLKRGISFERVSPEAWVSFSDREPTEAGEYVVRYNNRALCTFPTLESLLGAYRTYGAIEWRKL